MRKILISIGQRFHGLIVTGTCRGQDGRLRYVCKCDCGGSTNAFASELNNGKTWSCGCLRAKRAVEMKTTHGQSDTKLYKVWDSMKQRCDNPNNNRYYCYGARGIKVCLKWRHDFGAFYNFALAYGYKEGLSIERMDNDGDYCPENVTFIPLSEQGKNKRKIVRVA